MRGDVIAILLGAALAAASCGNEFAERSEITGLRVLAVQAEPPWVLPGETSTLQPLVVGAELAGPEPEPPVEYAWSWCPLRGPNSTGFACAITVDDLNAALGPGAPPIPDDFFSLGTEPQASLRLDLPTAFFEGDPEDPERFPGLCNLLRGRDDISRFVTLPDCDGTFPVSVRVDVRQGDPNAGGTIRTAFKDLTYVYDTSRVRELNTNPDVSGLGIEVLDAAGTQVTGPVPFEVTVRLQLGPDAPDGAADAPRLEQLDRLSETYTATRSGERVTTRERLNFSWFVLEGELDANRTGFLPDITVDDDGEPIPARVTEEWIDARRNAWSTPRPGDFPGGETTLILVVRDDRGGQSWTQQTVTVQGAIP